MTRSELEQQWTMLVDGRIERSELHTWSDPRAHAADTTDSMVMVGLQILHGATGTTFEPSLEEMARLLEAWRADCLEHDADPAAWRRALALATLRGLMRDHPERAPGAAAVFVREGILTGDEASAVLDPR
jgi:hypothetical protein